MKTYLLAFALLAVISLPAQAQTPRVRFDVPQTLAVRDVTTREFAFVHPQQRLIEVTLPISMLLEGGSPDAVRELVHRLESSTAAAQVVDYSPQTQLATAIVGATSVQQEQQHDTRLSFELGGSYYGLASGNASGNFTSHGREHSAYEKLPALELLTASGTIGRGRGVYFKLKPSPRTTLEGAYDYVVVLRVPATWRAGFIAVTSEARGRERSLGQGRFVVAIYQQGDIPAQRATQHYALAENDLRRLAVERREELQRRAYPTPLHRLGMTREGALPADWLEIVLYRSADEALLRRLPGDVQTAVGALSAARRAMAELNEPPTFVHIEG